MCMTQPSAGQPSDGPTSEEVELRWPDDVGADAEAVNQVLFTWDQNIEDMLYMYLGHVAPPPWLTPAIAAESMASTGGKLVVRPKGGFVLSRSRAEELWTALGRHLGKLPK